MTTDREGDVAFMVCMTITGVMGIAFGFLTKNYETCTIGLVLAVMGLILLLMTTGDK